MTGYLANQAIFFYILIFIALLLLGVAAFYRNQQHNKKEILELKKREQRYRELFENTNDLILSVDLEGNFEYVNKAFLDIVGYTYDEVLSLNILDIVHLDFREECKKVFTSIRHRIEVSAMETSFLTRDGRHIHVEGSIFVSYNDGSPVAARGIFRDMTDRKVAQERISYLAYHDALTDLPNRLLFRERLTQALARARKQQKVVGVLFLDLNRFKMINDTLGHSMGDKLLQSVAARLKKCVRATDTVSRLGGDEFTVCLPDLVSVEDCLKISKKIVERFKKPLKAGVKEFHITPSIGIATYPKDGEDVTTLLKNADMAMYKAKEDERQNYLLYTPSMNEEARSKIKLENELYNILDNKELTVYYQPQIKVSTGQIVGVEALARWDHPQLGQLLPQEFIQFANDTELIIPIGEAILYDACLQNVRWQKKGISPFKIAVNLSACQFRHGNLLATIERVLQDTGMDPGYLELEITEATAMYDTGHTVSLINQLKDTGVQIAIDDFGTDYASLTYLKALPPIDFLKIDNSCIYDLDSRDNRSKGIVSTMILLARNLNTEVVAEGVENEEQLAFLVKHGCDIVQGNYFKEAVSPEELEPLLMQGSVNSFVLLPSQIKPMRI